MPVGDMVEVLPIQTYMAQATASDHFVVTLRVEQKVEFVRDMLSVTLTAGKML
jgi:hypothetical protein